MIPKHRQMTTVLPKYKKNFVAFIFNDFQPFQKSLFFNLNFIILIIRIIIPDNDRCLISNRLTDCKKLELSKCSQSSSSFFWDKHTFFWDTRYLKICSKKSVRIYLRLSVHLEIDHFPGNIFPKIFFLFHFENVFVEKELQIK